MAEVSDWEMEQLLPGGNLRGISTKEAARVTGETTRGVGGLSVMAGDAPAAIPAPTPAPAPVAVPVAAPLSAAQAARHAEVESVIADYREMAARRILARMRDKRYLPQEQVEAQAREEEADARKWLNEKMDEILGRPTPTAADEAAAVRAELDAMLEASIQETRRQTVDRLLNR